MATVLVSEDEDARRRRVRNSTVFWTLLAVGFYLGFIVLILLASYGAHRYVLVYLYYKNKKNRTTEPSAHFPAVPRVTIQLPIFNEQFVVERLLDAICRLDYPLEKLDIQVLDDSTDETQQVARDCVERHQRLGVNISYVHRDNREGFKAGALQEGLQFATGEFVAIFDADFVPPSDFLRRTIPHFAEARVAVVQTRWGHLNQDFSLLTRAQSLGIDGHFGVEQAARCRGHLLLNFNGISWPHVTVATLHKS